MPDPRPSGDQGPEIASTQAVPQGSPQTTPTPNGLAGSSADGRVSSEPPAVSRAEPPATLFASQGRPLLPFTEEEPVRLEGHHLGRYRLVRIIGRGGMGKIWEAWDERLNRRVAIKILHTDEALTKDGLERFRREARNAAKLRHPNIVPIHDVGQAEGLDFIVMDFVEGITLAEGLRQQEMTWREKMILLERICRAVQYAHEQGVIHRDLKPGNVMLDWSRGGSSRSTRRDSGAPGARTSASAPGAAAAGAPSAVSPPAPVGGPTSPTGPTGPTRPTRPTSPNLSPPPPATPASGDDQPPRAAGLEPLVLDFGLAKDLDADVTLSQSGMSIGTPAYMPPEQAEGRLKESGPWSDVYSLGAILYEMLTGRVPFTGDNRLQVLRACILDDPVPPRRLSPHAPRDLETICLKCLQKSPGRRYQTVAALAADLRAWLDGESIVARPPTLVERARRRLRRHAALYITVACAVLAILGLTVGFMVSLYERRREAERARDNAVAAQEAEAQERRAAELAREAEAAERQKADTARLAAEEARATAKRETYAAQIRLAAAQVEAGDIGNATLVLDALPREYRHWEWGRLKYLCRDEALTFKAHPTGVTVLAVSPDGKTIASGAKEGPLLLWDAANGRQLTSLKENCGRVTSAAFSPDGQSLVTAEWGANPAPVKPEPTVRVWDARTGRERLALQGHTDRIRAVSFSPGGQQVLTASDDKTARIWDATTGRELSCLRGQEQPVTSCAFSPDGRLVVTASSANGKVKLWDATTAKNLWTVGEFEGVHGLALSPDGERLVAWTMNSPNHHWGGRAVVWETRTGQERAVLKHDTGVYSACFAADGRSVFTGTWPGVLRRWELADGTVTHSIKAHEGPVGLLQLSPDGSRLLTTSTDQTAAVWNAENGQLLYSMRGHTAAITGAFWLPGGQRLVTASLDGSVRVWDPGHPKEEKRVFDCGHRGFCLASFTAEAKKFMIWDVSVEGVSRSRLFDLETGRVINSLTFPPASTLKYDRRYRHILSREGDQWSLWDLATGQKLWAVPAGIHLKELHCMEPDLLWFTSGDELTTVDAPTGRLLWTRKNQFNLCARTDTSPCYALEEGKLLRFDRLTGRESPFWENPSLSQKSSIDVSDDESQVLVGVTCVPTLWDVKTNQALFTVGREKGRAWLCGEQAILFRDSAMQGSLYSRADGRKLVDLGRVPRVFTDEMARPAAERFMLVTGKSPAECLVVDLGAGKVVCTLRGHRGELSGAQFSTDGKRILTTSSDQSTKLWDASTGRELLSLKGHQGPMLTAVFSPDGRTILTSAHDGTAILWPALDWTKE